jgi:hypothetical protein
MSRLRRARTASTSEDGFTVIELVVATGLMFIVITAMLYTTVAGFRGIAIARGRQAASGLANQTVEQVRALPYNTLSLGLSNSDSTITGDTAISRSGAVWTYGGETIPHGDNPVTTPLNPHQQSVPKGTITYTVFTYLTYYTTPTTTTTIVSGSQPGGTPLRLTVVVQWKSPTGAGTSQVQVQTILYSPSGCLSSATHPFSAPCQAFLYANASVQPGQLNITSADPNVPFDYGALWLPSQSSGAQIEQIQAVQGAAQTAGLALKLKGVDLEQSKGRQQVTSGSDSDPGQPKPDYQTASAPLQVSDSLTATWNNGNNTLTGTMAGGDVASTMSTVTASNASHPCPLLVPSSSFDLAQNDSRPCGSSKGYQGGTLSGAMSVVAGGQTLITGLGSVAGPAASTPSGSFTNHDTAPEGTVCTQTSGADGCIEAQQFRTIGTVILIQPPVGSSLLPAAALPGYDQTKGMVKMTAYADKVTAEAGVGAAAPAAVVSGLIEYYNGTGYSTITPGPTPTPIPLGLGGGGVQSDPAIAPLLQISVTGNLHTGGTAVSDPAAGCVAPCTRTAASATANSPLVGYLTYTMTYAGSVVADVTASVDLGTMLAKSSYTAAPSGS